MKITKSYLRKIITEEIQNLTEYYRFEDSHIKNKPIQDIKFDKQKGLSIQLDNEWYTFVYESNRKSVTQYSLKNPKALRVGSEIIEYDRGYPNLEQNDFRITEVKFTTNKGVATFVAQAEYYEDQYYEDGPAFLVTKKELPPDWAK